MVNVAALESALARAATRSAQLRRMGDTVASDEAWAEAQTIGLALDRATHLSPEDEWHLLAGSPDHG